jgi:DNA-binding NarL/FixJ family response regulator
MRILIADDERKNRSALRLLLEQEKFLSIVGEVEDPSSLLMLVQKASPNVILLDWELSAGKSATVLSALKAKKPRICVIALSCRPEARQAALDAGVDAFVSKGDPPDHLLATLRNLNIKAAVEESKMELDENEK